MNQPERRLWCRPQVSAELFIGLFHRRGGGDQWRQLGQICLEVEAIDVGAAVPQSSYLSELQGAELQVLALL